MEIHSIRELVEIVEWRDDSVYKTRAVGLWYIPLGVEPEEGRLAARRLGGHEWGSTSTRWSESHIDDLFKRFPERGYYPYEEKLGSR